MEPEELHDLSFVDTNILSTLTTATPARRHALSRTLGRLLDQARHSAFSASEFTSHATELHASQEAEES